MKVLAIVVIAVILIIFGALLLGQSYPRGAFGGGGGGGWGEPANSGTVVIPGWIWSWLGGWLVGQALQPIWDCVSQGTCNQANGPVGGGGGGGIYPPPVHNLDRKRPAWDWLTFKSENGR